MPELVTRTLMGPGPSDVPPSVLLAMARPTIGHLDPVFLELMDQIRERLQRAFRTSNPMTMAISGTGSAGMETLFVNLVEPGDTVLIGRNGVFGSRMTDVAQRCGANVVTVDAPWGEIINLDELREAIAQHKPRVVALVHAETSTGIHQPIEGLADDVHAHGGLLVVDCVTSLGGMPVDIDGWRIDAAFSGAQKCLSCPPGLAPVTLSERAVDRIDSRKSPIQSWYLDLSMLRSYWGAERAYHHTAPVNMLYALHEALGLVLDEGLEQRFARHRRCHQRLASGLSQLGFEYLGSEAHRLPMLNAVSVPDRVDDATTRSRLLDQYGIEVGGGLGQFKGRAWRIGLMGHTARIRNVDLLLSALRELT